jgi:hypothetical protein
MTLSTYAIHALFDKCQQPLILGILSLQVIKQCKMKLPMVRLPKANVIEEKKRGWIVSVFSFVSGILAAILFMLSCTCTGGVDILPGGIAFFSISAIVSGVVGLSKPMSGLAIAGFTLGIMVVIPLLYILAIFLL